MVLTDVNRRSFDSGCASAQDDTFVVSVRTIEPSTRSRL